VKKSKLLHAAKMTQKKLLRFCCLLGCLVHGQASPFLPAKNKTYLGGMIEFKATN
jgi:hypothetical protein